MVSNNKREQRRPKSIAEAERIRVKQAEEDRKRAEREKEF